MGLNAYKHNMKVMHHSNMTSSVHVTDFSVVNVHVDELLPEARDKIY
jgi:hypothetical protein